MLVWLIAYFLIYFAPAPVATRKYDVELESMKLYGEDLKSVLARFRRTPEYLEFLKMHLDDLKKEREEISHYLLNIYHQKLKDGINAMFGMNNSRRQNFGDNIRLKTMLLRADEDENNTTESEEAVRKLDSYPLLHSVLTVDERNNFRDHGYEVAGELIHALMKSLGPEEKMYQSTRQPWGESNNITTTTTTTKHSHLVTRNSSVVTIYANLQNSTGTKKPLRYRKVRKLIF